MCTWYACFDISALSAKFYSSDSKSKINSWRILWSGVVYFLDIKNTRIL
jgi:hypothetical protein